MFFVQQAVVAVSLDAKALVCSQLGWEWGRCLGMQVRGAFHHITAVGRPAFLQHGFLLLPGDPDAREPPFLPVLPLHALWRRRLRVPRDFVVTWL